MVVLLYIFSWFWQWNNLENQLIFGKVKAYKKCANFLDHHVCNVYLISRMSPSVLASALETQTFCCYTQDVLFRSSFFRSSYSTIICAASLPRKQARSNSNWLFSRTWFWVNKHVHAWWVMLTQNRTVFWTMAQTLAQSQCAEWSQFVVDFTFSAVSPTLLGFPGHRNFSQRSPIRYL